MQNENRILSFLAIGLLDLLALLCLGMIWGSLGGVRRTDIALLVLLIIFVPGLILQLLGCWPTRRQGSNGKLSPKN